MSKQQQFLDVVDRDEAERRFQAAISLQPLGKESVALDECRGRILAEDIIATVDVPSFAHFVKRAPPPGMPSQEPR